MPEFGVEIDQITRHGLPRFHGPGDFNRSDTVLVRNEADELHEMILQRVKPGIDNRS